VWVLEETVLEKQNIIRRISDLPELGRDEASALELVTREFEFRVPKYYAALIDWTNPNDPLRKIILPNVEEILSDLDLDPSDEAENTLVHGLQHKYKSTALLLVNDVCAAYCRFCFRKRFTLATSVQHHIVPAQQLGLYENETSFEVGEAIAYIADHKEINNVLITGGDPLMLSLGRLEKIVKTLREISHVKIIRIGTKVPAFDPNTISDALLDMLASYVHQDRRIYLMMHFNHPRELTHHVLKLIDRILVRGIIVCNQTPLLRGVNDNAQVLVSLLNLLADGGITPHYIFQCRPTKGNEPYMMTIQKGLQIVSAVRAQLSGLAKRFRYVASHATGKIEIIGHSGENMVFRYHEAKYPGDEDRVFMLPSSNPIYWFDPIPSQVHAATE
jgi:lysine 2,3-aminomutase